MEKKKTTSKIGGQAVLEGVMMRGKSVIATAVRDSSGTIQVESTRFKPNSEKSVFFRIPIIRGVLSFVTSMVTGMKTLTRASEVYGDLVEEEPGKFEKWLAEKLKLNLMDVVTFIGVILGVALAVGLFVFLPNLATDGLFKLISLDGIQNETVRVIVKNLTSGVIRIAIFVLYILACTLMKDIKRLFRYHGAEHKTISCYEHGLPLTVENAQKMSTIHDRCGTTFMFLVMIISIIFFSFFGWQELWLRMLIRLAGIPVVAGISYEILMFLARFDNPFVRILKAPGLLLQKLTTKEPDDSMVEVAILAFNTVLAMEADKTLPETKFITAVNAKKVREELEKKLGEKRAYEADIILMHVTGAKSKTALQDARLTSEHADAALAFATRRAETTEPLQYILGATCFYGYDFKTDARALIPRPDTEILAEAAIKAAAGKTDLAILEVCTGSGAVAVAIKKTLPTATVTATDISPEALSLAKENAERNEAEIEWVESDLFETLDARYDIIVINPPYIPEKDIAHLDAEVKDWEPQNALSGGEDGLLFYRRIAAEYSAYLKEGGVLLLEIGIGQRDAVAALFGERTVFIKDYNTPPVDRVAVVQKGESA